ncbi:MAG: cysteine desulfurase, partial [Candidatus Komeilibacteria bacterium]|nr:cysteine desulfurase [Candidatus Komeilibacteria bacterium]
MSRNYIYLDHAAATPVAPEVLRAMQPYWREQFANPSSLHSAGREAKRVLEQCRKSCALLLNCLPDEVIFTSGGTESINLALKGYVASRKKRQHIVSTTIEHAATLETLHRLKKEGHRITLVSCDHAGMINSDDVIAAIRPDTTLVTVIVAQNEIGTIEPVAEIGKRLTNVNRERAKKNLPPVVFHTDACQAPAWMDVNMEKLHVDMLSLDASKFYGPKGIGILVKRRNVVLEPQIDGGGQQHNFRSGTEPLALIVGATAALGYVAQKRQRSMRNIARLRDYLLARVTDEIPDVLVTGHLTNRIANSASFVFAGVEGETLVLRLDREGVASSTGSACSTAEREPSHVIAALNLPPRFQAGSLRLTLGYGITKEHIDEVVRKLKR